MRRVKEDLSFVASKGQLKELAKQSKYMCAVLGHSLNLTDPGKVNFIRFNQAVTVTHVKHVDKNRRKNNSKTKRRYQPSQET